MCKAGAEWPEKYPVFEHIVLDLRDFNMVYNDISPAVIIGLTRKSICRKDRQGGFGVNLYVQNVKNQSNTIFD